MPNFSCLIDVVGRYMSDGNSKLQIRLEKHESPINAVEDESADSLIPQAIRDFVLPAGFPGGSCPLTSICSLYFHPFT